MRGTALGLALLLPSLCAVSQGLPSRPEELPPSPPPAFSPPVPARATLSNGMRLILLPDHALPLVRLTACVQAGSVYDPEDRPGVALLTGESLKAGGTRRYPADAMLESLESMAAELTTEIGTEEGRVTLSVLAKDLPRALPVFADLLMHPAFAPEKVAVEKAKLIEGLRRVEEDPFGVSLREMKKRLYGAASPWARTARVADLEALGPADLAAFHARYFCPGGVILAASGDFDPKALERALAGAFAAWKPGRPGYPAVAPAPQGATPGVLLMDKPGLTQTTVLVGQLTAPRGTGAAFNRDTYAMDVANFYFGGGDFSSRLMREIRSNRGLAYGAGSTVNFGTSRGFLIAYTQTAPETTAQTLEVLRREFTRAAAEPPSGQELAGAKESLVNQFVFRYQNAGQIVSRAAVQEMEGYPADYLATYLERVKAVTAQDCRAVFAKYVKPAELTYFVLGPAGPLKEPLAAFGEVEVQKVPQP